jgi:hypothetical protein
MRVEDGAERQCSAAVCHKPHHVEQVKYGAWLSAARIELGYPLRFGSAVSTDGLVWTPEPGLRVTSKRVESEGDFDVGHPTALRLADGSWRIYYQSTTGMDKPCVWASSSSSDGLSFTRDAGVRLDLGSSTDLTFAGHGRVWMGRDGRLRGLYSGNTSDDTGPSDIGTFVSDDGLAFTIVAPHAFPEGHDPAAFVEADGTVTVVFSYLLDGFDMTRTSDDGATWTATERLVLLDVDGSPIVSAKAGDFALSRLPGGGSILYGNWSDGTIRSFRPVL